MRPSTAANLARLSLAALIATAAGVAPRPARAEAPKPVEIAATTDGRTGAPRTEAAAATVVASPIAGTDKSADATSGSVELDARALPSLSMPRAPTASDLGIAAAAPVAAPSASPTAPPAAASLPAAVADPRLAATLAAVRAMLGQPSEPQPKAARKGEPDRKADPDKDDRAALAAYYQSAERLLWVDATGLTARGEAAIREIRAADDYGLRARDFDLPQRIAADPQALADAEASVALAAMKYARHARGGRIDPLELSQNLDRKPPVLAPAAVIAGLAAASAPDAYLRGLHPRHPQFERLRQKYLEARASGTAQVAVAPAQEALKPEPKAKGARKQAAAPEQSSPPATVKKLLANMEMWRWMPEDLGQRHVFANVPEFIFRYVKDGKPIHTERIIVGKPETQTPMFSDLMENIVFHPTWSVPDSIKVKEILPGLARGSNVMARQGLKAVYNGREIDPMSVDWRSVDIRAVHVFQPSGQGNALGLLKFNFPNSHHVYMHDTPMKPLFNQSIRTFSHGCVRVRNPQRFAEVIFAEDKGWGADRIKSLLDTPQQNNMVQLSTRIPVHISYFTAWVDEDGKLATFRDMYGHEEKVHLGLDGKAHLIPRKKEDLGKFRADVVARLSENSFSQPNVLNWMKQLFGN